MSTIVDDVLTIATKLDGLLPEPEKTTLALLVAGAEFVEAALLARNAGLPKDAFVSAVEGALKAASDARMKAELPP